jgi:hypothetical protein
MGFFDFLLKKSSKVGGTARWVADAYNAVRKSNPKLSHLEILKEVNAARCCGYRDSNIVDGLNDWLMDSDVINKGLFSYVYTIIQKESRLIELPSECKDAIVQELSKAGIEQDVMFYYVD